jgi:hypothetical protein
MAKAPAVCAERGTPRQTGILDNPQLLPHLEFTLTTCIRLARQSDLVGPSIAHKKTARAEKRHRAVRAGRGQNPHGAHFREKSGEVQGNNRSQITFVAGALLSV